MDVFETIHGRRSIRKFTSRAVEETLLEKLIDAARLAPSGGNTQPWRFIVVKNEINIRLLRAVSPGLFGEPSVVIVVCYDTAVTPEETLAIKILDIGAAIQNLLLAAHALSLGACWIGSANWRGVKEIVGIPEQSSIEPISLVTIGYPAENPPQRFRHSVEVITFSERFGDHWNIGEETVEDKQT